MPGAVTVGGLVINLSAETSQLKTDMAEGTRAVEAGAKAMINSMVGIKESSDRVTDAGARMVKQLKDEIATFGMSSEQLAQQKANLAGVGAEYEALTRRLNAMRTAQASFGQDVETTSRAMRTHGEDVRAAGGHMEGFSLQTAGAKRELLVLAHELSQGNYKKFGGSMLVLGEQTGAAGLLFSAAGLSAIAMGAAVIGVGAALLHGAEQQRAMNNALIETGNYAGVTSDSLNALAHAAVATGGSIGEAKKAVTELAGSGKFTGDQIGYIADAAVAMEHATGKSIDKTIEEFESLAVQSTGSSMRSSEAISKATLKLDDQYHFLTESIYEQIRALEKEGDQKGASALATETLARVTKERAEEMIHNIGSIQRGWNSVKEVIGEVIDGIGKVGMRNTAASDAAKASAKLASFDQGAAAIGITDPEHQLTGSWAETRKKLVLELVGAYDKLNQVDAAAIKQGKDRMAQSEAAHAASRIEQDDIRLGKKGATELDDAIQKYGEDLAKIAAANPTSKLLDQDAVNAHMAELVKAHTQVTKKAAGLDDRSQVLQDQLTLEQTALAREKSVYDARAEMLDLYHTKFGMADADFYAGRATARAEYLASEAISFAKESALVKAAEAQARNPQEVAAAKAKYDQLVAAHTKFVDDMRNAGGKDRASADAAEKKLYDDAVKATVDAGAASIKSLDAQIAKQKEHNAEIGKTKEQVELAKQAQVDLATKQLQSDADFLRDGLAKWDLDEKSQAVYRIRLNDLDAEIAKRKELSGLFAAGADQEALAKASADLDKYLDPTKAHEFGNALKGSLGAAARSMTELTNAMQVYGKQQAVNEKARKEAQILLQGDDKARAKGLEALDEISRRSTKEQLGSYGNMASAAAGFFDEHSRGYQALMTVSQVFHAAELAMTMAELVPKAISAVLTQGQGDPYTAFGRMAAMGALVAGLGVAIGGLGGADTTSKDRQAAQGAGSVLGDKDAKSESLKKSLDLIEKNTYQGLAISTGMLATLRSIDSNISSFASHLVGSTDIANPKFALNTNNGFASTVGTLGMAAGGAALGGMAGAGLTAFTTVGAVGGPIGMVIGAVAGAILSKIPAVANLMTSIFGGKQSVSDSGFKMDSTTLASIMGNGAHAFQYADIKTSGGWFGSDKTSEKATELSAAANQQFTSIIKSLAESVKGAGAMLGLASDDFTDRLNSFVVDLGQVSLKDLKGDELQKALEAVFSKLGDDMAQYAVGGLQDLQQVGEGYLETLARVASEYQTVEVVFQSFGKTFGQLGLESIAARDRLVQLAGGLDKFTSQGEYFLTNFFSEKEQAAALRARIEPTLAQYGLSSAVENAEKMFRDFVVGLDTTTEAGAKAYTVLMGVAPALKQVVGAESSALEERKSLRDKLDELTMTSAQLHEKERAAIDGSNLALYDRVAALQAEKDAASNLLAGVDNAFATLQKVVAREKSAIQSTVDAHSAAVSRLQGLSQALGSAFDGSLSSSQKALERRRAQAEIKADLAITRAGGTLSDAQVESLKKALGSATQDAAGQFSSYQDYLRDLYGTQSDIKQLGDLTDASLSVEQQALKASQDQLKRLDDIVTNGQEQIALLKGESVANLTLAQVLSGFQSSLGAAQANPVVSGTASIAGFYQDLLGRAPDQAGLQYWQNVFSGGASLDNIRSVFMGSDEYRDHQRKLGIPGFASGGTFGGGLRLVGENGPELEVTGPSRIFSASDTAGLISRLGKPAENNAVLVAAVERLTKEVEGLRAEARATAGHTEKTSRVLSRVVDGDALRTSQESA